MAFGKNLRTERRKRDITQKELAEAIGKEQSTIARIESGKKNPSFETLVDIAKYLDVSFDCLLRD